MRALQLQLGVGEGADALGVANVDCFARSGEVGVDAVLIGEESADGEQAAAAHCGQGSDFEPVLIELERAVQLAEAVGQIFKRERAILEIDASLQGGILQAARALRPGRW